MGERENDPRLQNEYGCFGRQLTDPLPKVPSTPPSGMHQVLLKKKRDHPVAPAATYTRDPPHHLLPPPPTLYHFIASNQGSVSPIRCEKDESLILYSKVFSSGCYFFHIAFFLSLGAKSKCLVLNVGSKVGEIPLELPSTSPPGNVSIGKEEEEEAVKGRQTLEGKRREEEGPGI